MSDASSSKNWRMQSATSGSLKSRSESPKFGGISNARQTPYWRSKRNDTPETREKFAGSSGQYEENTRPEDDSRTQQAIDEGRRLYVGNMPYFAKTADVTKVFSESGFEMYGTKSFVYSSIYMVTLCRDYINMSIDPFTGRNPSYCFVELKTTNEAETAMKTLSGKIFMGRPLKIGPGVTAHSKRSQPPTHDNRGGRRPPEANETPRFDRWARSDASAHWSGYADEGRRVWLGGIPRMADHHTVEAEVREVVTGFEVYEKSLRLTVKC